MTPLSDTNRIISRIAPTPSGFLHLGNALNFLLVQKLTGSYGGSIRLRIDDMDTARSRPEYLADIFESLRWLDISWHLGPQDVEEHRQSYAQYLRLSSYEQFVQKLLSTGLVFGCSCSRKELADQKACVCRERSLPLEQPDIAWRIHTPQDATIAFDDGIAGPCCIVLADVIPNFVIRRRDGLPAYQVTSLVDDLEYRNNLIVRGEDLLASTAAQLYLAQLTGSNTFSATTFYHHPLLRDDSGEKLSKSAGSNSLLALREAGVPAQRVQDTFHSWLSSVLYRNQPI